MAALFSGRIGPHWHRRPARRSPRGFS